MTLSASEIYEAGLSLSPSARKDVAMRLLDTLDVLDQTAVDEAWNLKIASRVDDIASGRVIPIPHDQVLSRLAERRAARHSAR